MTSAEWPGRMTGIVESIVTTRQPAGAWNVSALGLRAGEGPGPTEPVTARTWGDTRTSRNFDRDGTGYVQFWTDPVQFVEAALDRWERDEPLLDDVAAWVEVAVSRTGSGSSAGTDWVDWELDPIESAVRRRSVPLHRRSRIAVVEMTVAASRLDVRGYDGAELRDRLTNFAAVTERCGDRRERAAVDRIVELSDWSPDDTTEPLAERDRG